MCVSKRMLLMSGSTVVEVPHNVRLWLCYSSYFVVIWWTRVLLWTLPRVCIVVIDNSI